MKKCTKCKNVKLLSDFYLNSRGAKRSECKMCTNKDNNKREKTKQGLIYKIYRSQKCNSIKRNHILPEYTRNELKEWIYSQPNFNKLYNDWVKSNYDIKLKPSIDRIDSLKHYYFDNIQLVTWNINHINSNNEKMTISNRNIRPVLKIDNNIITEYISISDAARKNNLHHSNIYNVCIGKYKHSGGFKWKFKI